MNYIWQIHESTKGRYQTSHKRCGISNKRAGARAPGNGQCKGRRFGGVSWRFGSAICMYVAMGVRCMHLKSNASHGRRSMRGALCRGLAVQHSGQTAHLLVALRARGATAAERSGGSGPLCAQPRVGVREAVLLPPKLATPLPPAAPRVLKAVAPLWPYSGCWAAAATAGASASATAETAA